MRPLHEILLPADFSPASVWVARYAAGVARHFSSKIILLNVLPPLNPAFAVIPKLDVTVACRWKMQTDWRSAAKHSGGNQAQSAGTHIHADCVPEIVPMSGAHQANGFRTCRPSSTFGDAQVSDFAT